MAIKTKYATKEEIPAAFLELYTEQGGAWVLTGVEGMKTVDDVDRLQTALNKERNDHKATKDKLAAWGSLDPAEALPKLDRIAELEQAAGGKLDDKAIDAIVEARIGTRVGPLNRQIETLTRERDEFKAANETYTAEKRSNTIRDAIRRQAVEDKVIPTAVDDLVLIAEREMDLDENGKVIVKGSGLSPKDWLNDQKKTRSHFWPASAGGGAGGNLGGGGGADNPWSAEGWNLTKQGEIVVADPARADALAKAAGTKVGGLKPIAKKK